MRYVIKYIKKCNMNCLKFGMAVACPATQLYRPQICFRSRWDGGWNKIFFVNPYKPLKLFI